MSTVVSTSASPYGTPGAVPGTTPYAAPVAAPLSAVSWVAVLAGAAAAAALSLILLILGTGLGLSIVKHVVQRHDGVLRITSEKGKGSVFTLLVPAARVRLKQA